MSQQLSYEARDSRSKEFVTKNQLLSEVPSFSVVIPTSNRREKLVRLIDSIFQGDYPISRLEVIVVDDASSDGTCDLIRKKFPAVKLIRNEKRLVLASSRNKGIRASNSDIVLFVDDDMIMDKQCISQLARTMTKDPTIGICGPIVYYLADQMRVWGAGVRRDMITSLTQWVGRDELDHGQFNKLIESADLPNAAVRYQVIKEVGLFNDLDFPIQFDEADFGERVRRAGYRIVCNPLAKIWHDVPLPEETRSKARLYHIHEEVRAFYAGRNRIVFFKKYAKTNQLLIFLSLTNWFLATYYISQILRLDSANKSKILTQYLKGVLSGLRYEPGRNKAGGQELVKRKEKQQNLVHLVKTLRKSEMR